MSRRLKISLIFFAFLAFKSNAQEWQPEWYFYGGTIIKHSDKIGFDTDVFSPGINFHTSRSPSFETKDWEKYYSRTSTGWTGSVRYLGGDFLGYALAVFPTIEYQVLSSKSASLTLEFGSGIAYISRPYEAIDNPKNNAIGSSINNITNLRFKAHWNLPKRYDLSFGVELTHYSNGALTLPNLGINYVSPYLGINKRIAYSANKIKAPRINKWRPVVAFRYSRLEWIVPNGPKYPLYNISVGAKWIKTEKAHWGIGLEYEINYSVYWFGLNRGEFRNKDEAYNESYRLIPYLNREIVFGRWSIIVQTGYNLRKVRFPPPTAFANLLGVKHYFYPKSSFTPYVGIYLKAHGTVAEYMGIGIGMEFL